MKRDFEFQTVPKIVCASGSLTRLPALIAEQFTATRILIITDQGIVNCGLAEPVRRALVDAGMDAEVFSNVIADPSSEIIEEALNAAKIYKCDLVIGLGGGSSMDAAKLVALLLKSGQRLDEIYGVGAVRGARQTPLVLIPTTAGTGSEVTPISIVTTGKTQKMGVVSPQLYADIALLDAELTLGLPAHVTAATGIDAMVHAIEAYTSKHKKNPVSDMMAREALRLMSDNIITAVHHGDNLEARANMLLGAMWAGQAFANAPVAAVHALAYPLGGIFHVPHGLSNALVLPHVLRFNAQFALPDYAALARFIFPDTQGADQAMTEHLIEHLDDIIEKTDIERRLRDVGVKASDIGQLADDAMLQTRLLVNNPREVTRDDAIAIYQAAF